MVQFCWLYSFDYFKNYSFTNILFSLVFLSQQDIVSNLCETQVENFKTHGVIISSHYNPGLTTNAISKHNFNPVYWAINPKLQLNHNNTEPRLFAVSYTALYSPSAVGPCIPTGFDNNLYTGMTF